MKVVSSKSGSSRQRVDIEAKLLVFARWITEWESDHDDPDKMRATGRTLMLHSPFDSDRDIQLRLTENEAFAIFKAVFDSMVAAEDKRLLDENMPG